MSIERPELLLLLALVPLLLRRPLPVEMPRAPFAWSSAGEEGFRPVHPWIGRMATLPRAFTALGVAGLLVVAAGPVRLTPSVVPPERAVAVILVVDVSGSMREGPLGATPLDRTRDAALDLLAASPGYRVGLVTFAANALTRLPPTADPARVREVFGTLEAGARGGGSAVGTALGLAVERLRIEEAAARTVILVSDGIDNAGPLPPASALELARDAGVLVHMIAPGSFDDPAGAATAEAIRAAGGAVEQAGSGSGSIREALARQIPDHPVPGPPVRRPQHGWIALAATLLIGGGWLGRTRLGGLG